jgi:hypothetical protein
LEETAAADRSRTKRDFAAYRDQLETLALAAKKSRRAAEVAESWWRQHPTQDNLEAAKAAQASRKAAVDAPREICLDDEQMIDDVYRRYGR